MKKFLFTLLLVFVSKFCDAALMISPTRVVFDERQRTAQVVVVNTSNELKTYRLEWVEKVAKAQGGTQEVKPPQALDTSLASMARISPKQVRLAPGERQVVKIALRKPKSLTHSEYRSYLRFKALPNIEEKQTDNIGIQVNMVLSYSVPVIMRATNTAPKVDIANILVVKDKIKQKGQIGIELLRGEGASSFGILEVFFTPNGTNKQERIAVLNDFSIYPETPSRSLTLNLLENSILSQAGTLKIRYKGKKEYRNITFSEKSFAISPSDIKEL